MLWGYGVAYDLIEKGYSNITIIADQFVMDWLLINNAGGLLKPSFMDYSPNARPMMNKIAVNAYKVYSAIAKKQQSNQILG